MFHVQVLSLLVLAPVFLMTLLESQGLLSWLRELLQPPSECLDL